MLGQISRQGWSYSDMEEVYACMLASNISAANLLPRRGLITCDPQYQLAFHIHHKHQRRKRKGNGRSVSLRSRVDRDSDREGKTASPSLSRPSPVAVAARTGEPRACLHSSCSRRPAGRGRGSNASPLATRPPRTMPRSSRRIVLKPGLDRATSWLTAARGLFTGLAR